MTSCHRYICHTAICATLFFGFLRQPAVGQSVAQRELRARIQKIVAENEPESLEPPTDSHTVSVPGTYMRYWAPEVRFDYRARVLWYDLGDAVIDDEFYELRKPGKPFESDVGGDFPVSPPNDLPAPEAPKPPNDLPAPEATKPPSDSPLPETTRQQMAKPADRAPLYYPIKAQLLVELLRKHRAEGRAAWEPVLQEIEKVVDRELKLIETSPPPGTEKWSDLQDFLKDCDEQVHRLAIGHIDRVAKEQSLVVRRIRIKARPAPILIFQVTLLPEPQDAKLYVISDFKYWCLKRKSYEKDFTLWQSVGTTAGVAGDCHIVAVWGEGNNAVTSDYRIVNRINKDLTFGLKPKEAPRPVR